MSDRSAANPARRAFFLRSVPAEPSVMLDDHCLSARGISCECCRDACDTGALQFLLQRGGPAKPQLNPDLCTRCGECAQLCPEQALRVLPREAVAHG